MMRSIRDRINDMLDAFADALGLQPRKIPVPVKSRKPRKKK